MMSSERKECQLFNRSPLYVYRMINVYQKKQSTLHFLSLGLVLGKEQTTVKEIEGY